MDALDILARVDALIALANKQRDAEINAGACRTAYDYDKAHRAREAFEQARVDLETWLEAELRAATMKRRDKAPTVRQKLEALKRGVELPVSARALAYVSDPGPDEKACLTLAETYQRAEEGPRYVMVTWANQEKACAFFNEHGLSETLTEIVRIGGTDALQ